MLIKTTFSNKYFIEKKRWIICRASYMQVGTFQLCNYASVYAEVHNACLSCYNGLEACWKKKTNLDSLDFVVNMFLMKLFHTTLWDKKFHPYYFLQ